MIEIISTKLYIRELHHMQSFDVLERTKFASSLNYFYPGYIMDEKERKQVKYLYIETLFCAKKSILYHFASTFIEMANALANINNNDLVVCACAKSLEGLQFMRSLGFQQKDKVWDDTLKLPVPYLSIPFKTLKVILQDRTKLKVHIVGDKPLTKFDNFNIL